MRILPLFFVALILHDTQRVWATTTTMGSSRASKRSINASAQHDTSIATNQPAVVSPVPRVSLPELAREAVAIHFNASKYQSLDELIDATPVCADYQKPFGVFVTLSRHGQTRACWGSVDPDHRNLVEATVRTAESALTKEYRFKKISASEWRLLKPQVTIVRSIEPIESLSAHNAVKYGLLVRSGGRGGVLLPGEVIDARYQAIKCKLKAGIPVNQPCQLYRIRADVLK